MPQLLPMNIIVAVDAGFGIGKNSTLPWNLPKEFKHFVDVTTRTRNIGKINAVLMGRKCWESIPEKFKPLKGRLNIVLSRSMEPTVSEQVIFVRELEDALATLSKEPFKDKIESIWNIGGHDIYMLGINHQHLHKLVVTKLNRDFQCDVRFPAVDWEKFEQNNDFKPDKFHEENGVIWNVTSYTKKKGD